MQDVERRRYSSHLEIVYPNVKLVMGEKDSVPNDEVQKLSKTILAAPWARDDLDLYRKEGTLYDSELGCQVLESWAFSRFTVVVPLFS